jgi:hypothetical protein
MLFGIRFSFITLSLPEQRMRVKLGPSLTNSTDLRIMLDAIHRSDLLQSSYRGGA